MKTKEIIFGSILIIAIVIFFSFSLEKKDSKNELNQETSNNILKNNTLKEDTTSPNLNPGSQTDNSTLNTQTDSKSDSTKDSSQSSTSSQTTKDDQTLSQNEKIIRDYGPHYCTNESRNVQECEEEQNPVCGWLDPNQIQCQEEECFLRYSNECMACKEIEVVYWIDGDCPLHQYPS